MYAVGGISCLKNYHGQKKGVKRMIKRIIIIILVIIIISIIYISHLQCTTIIHTFSTPPPPPPDTHHVHALIQFARQFSEELSTLRKCIYFHVLRLKNLNSTSEDGCVTDNGPTKSQPLIEQLLPTQIDRQIFDPILLRISKSKCKDISIRRRPSTHYHPFVSGYVECAATRDSDIQPASQSANVEPNRMRLYHSDANT